MRISDWSSDVCSSDLLLAQLFDVRALLADDDARAVGIDRHAAQLCRAFDHDLVDRSLRQGLEHILADLQILNPHATIILAFCQPAAVPAAVDYQSQANPITLLTPLTPLLPVRDTHTAYSLPQYK